MNTSAYGRLITDISMDAVAKSIEHVPCLRKIGSSVPGQVKPMSYKMYARHFQAWYLALVVQGKDWSARCQDNATASDNGSLCQWLDFPVGQYNKVAISVHCHKSVPVPMWPYVLHVRKTPSTNQPWHHTAWSCDLLRRFSWLHHLLSHLTVFTRGSFYSAAATWMPCYYGAMSILVWS